MSPDFLSGGDFYSSFIGESLTVAVALPPTIPTLFKAAPTGAFPDS